MRLGFRAWYPIIISPHPHPQISVIVIVFFFFFAVSCHFFPCDCLSIMCVLSPLIALPASFPSLVQASTSVHVTNSNANAARPLIVAGYNVSGSVRSDGEPMKGVKFLLFSPSVTKEVRMEQG